MRSRPCKDPGVRRVLAAMGGDLDDREWAQMFGLPTSVISVTMRDVQWERMGTRQHQALLLLRRGALPTMALAHEMDVQANHLHTILDRLKRRGLVRSDDATGFRQHIHRITKFGRRVLAMA